MFQESKELTVTNAPRVGKWHELAEAMRRGCKALPVQCFGEMYQGADAACALGAAYSTGINAVNLETQKSRGLKTRLERR